MKVLHLTDHHFPFHDKRAVQLSLEALALVKPHTLVLGGDMLDCYSVSRYMKAADRMTSLQTELDIALAYLDACRKYAGPRCRIILTAGNHEERIEKYLAREAPGLSSLRALQLRHLLDCDKHHVTLVKPGGSYSIGSLTFVHGDVIRKGAGRSAAIAIESEGRNTVMGHSHRLGCVTVRRGHRIYRGFESGCLCDLHPHYMNHRPDWQRGFSLFTLWGPRRQSFSWTPIWLNQLKPLEALK